MLRLLTAFTALSLAACGQSDPATPDLAPDTPPPAIEAPDTDSVTENNYTDMASWLCHPDKADDACAIDLDATAINSDGSTSLVTFKAASDPAIDCFYVYPTVSLDTTPNSDMDIGPEELNVVANQFARYAASCRLFAPMYRQRTLGAMRQAMASGTDPSDEGLAYDDILNSWETYLRDHNDGRGIVIVGHSQGAGIVFDLLDRAIIQTPVRDQLVAVHSIGHTEAIDPDTGAWKTMPLCQSSSDTGCIINYESFRATTPPPASTGFGKANEEGRAICVNPGDLVGNDNLDAYMPRLSFGRSMINEYGAAYDTPFVTLPGLITASCQANDTHDWLAIFDTTAPGDVRAGKLQGDVVIGGQVIAEWGLHVIDVNLAIGNLVSLADTQGTAWLNAQEQD